MSQKIQADENIRVLIYDCTIQEKIRELNIQISEIEEMLTHFILLKELNPDQDRYIQEVAFWRRYLQNAKRMKREVLAET